jgi:sec-independent protein translocase protein TatA
MIPLFAFLESLFQPTHMLILLIVAVLLFGKRLPEIARSLGKGVVEFKKGLKGLEDEIQGGNTSSPQEPAALQPPPRPPQRVQATAPKFEDNAGAVTTPPQAQP